MGFLWATLAALKLTLDPTGLCLLSMHHHQAHCGFLMSTLTKLKIHRTFVLVSSNAVLCVKLQHTVPLFNLQSKHELHNAESQIMFWPLTGLCHSLLTRFSGTHTGCSIILKRTISALLLIILLTLIAETEEEILSFQGLQMPQRSECSQFQWLFNF